MGGGSAECGQRPHFYTFCWFPSLGVSMHWNMTKYGQLSVLGTDDTIWGAISGSAPPDGHEMGFDLAWIVTIMAIQELNTIIVA